MLVQYSTGLELAHSSLTDFAWCCSNSLGFAIYFLDDSVSLVQDRHLVWDLELQKVMDALQYELEDPPLSIRGCCTVQSRTQV
jgi:hypothetical protein